MSSLYAVGSGLNIPKIVSELVAADRAPTENRINNQGKAATAKLSALSTIKSALSNLQGALDSLSTNLSTPAFKSTVAEGAGFSASSTAQASAGSYEIEVLSLARGNKLSSAAFASDERVGAGTLDIGFAGTTLQVEIGADATLSSVAREINRVAGGKGVTASVITSDAGQHLVLAATGTGAGNAVTVSASGADRLGELSWDGSAGGMTQTTAASQAQVKIDGQLRSGDSNTFTDLVAGMTITLEKPSDGKAHSLSVAADSSLAKGSLQSFVSTYNATLTALKNASSYNAETKTASALTGDAMVRGLQSQLRGILGGEYTVGILGDGARLSALPIIKIEPATEFYDYEAKYNRDDTQYRCPCGLPEARELDIRVIDTISVKSYKGVGSDAGQGELKVMKSPDPELVGDGEGILVVDDLVDSGRTLELVRTEAADSGVVTRVQLAPDLPAVEGDADRLQQVLMNVLLNGLQARAEGGRLEVAAEADADGVEVRVTDTGRGIAPELQAQVFFPYFTTKPGGSGLGLAISQKIVADHHGTIEIESESGQGTTVVIRLPRRQPANGAEKTSGDGAGEGATPA